MHMMGMWDEDRNWPIPILHEGIGRQKLLLLDPSSRKTFHASSNTP